MRTSTSNVGSRWKISLAICSPSNRRSWRDEHSSRAGQNTTGEFVSYVHVDNRTFGRDLGWVETLVENLREALPQGLKRGQPDIWRDPRLSSSEPFPDAIREFVTHSATLLVILSESYLTSEWCQRELTLFLQAAAQTGGATGRIFLVRLDTLEYNRWP